MTEQLREAVDAEMARLKPQFTRGEWFTLELVVRASLVRLAETVAAMTPENEQKA